MEIRRVRPDEYEEAGRVTALAYQGYAEGREGWWEDYIDRIADVAGRAEATTVLIAVDDGSILGTATLETDRRIEPDRDPPPTGTAEVRMLGVAPHSGGHGIGLALMIASENEARSLGATRMVLHTNEDMLDARRLYDRLGYRREQDVETPGGHVILTYAKDL